MRILVAEDNPRMAAILRRAFEREGCMVSVAFDGEQALAMGMSGGLDLLVLDVRHNFYASLSYPLPLGRSVLLRGWELSGITTIRSGLPLTVTVARNATALLPFRRA